MKKLAACLAMALTLCHEVSGQVDTSFIYRTNMPYGTLDLRIAKSATRYYYLQEDKTFSFRENSPGVKTNSYRDMTSWDSSPYKQGNLREKNGSQDYFVLNYRLLFPLNYNSAYSPGYPLIIMMHGAGERGNCWDSDCYWDTKSWNPTTNNPAAPTSWDEELLNNDNNLLHGGEVHLQARNLAGSMLPDNPDLPARAFPGFVLFPQNLNGWVSGNVQDAIRLVRLLVKRYHIDPDRIYIHGLSNGGMATYDMIKRAPWLFAAALPMSAPTEAAVINQNLLASIASIPLWIFQGGQDTAPAPGRTHGYVAKFREAGLLVRYTEYSNLGHGVWNSAYDEPDFFSWMLQQNKADIHLFAGASKICETNGQGVRMQLADGFFRYQWERNGTVISGATGATYVADTPGTYRARFSRAPDPSAADWNQWSDPVTVSSQAMAKPVVSQTGTVALKGLDNYPYALLQAEETFPHYYWYKDGALINLPGSQDDTTRHVKLLSGDCSSGACAGNGVYTLVVASDDYCPSPPSDGKFIFFNNQAPLTIAAPGNFAGTALSDGRVALTWNDVSGNENGFEVWRRRQTGPTSYSPWSMAPITAPNSTAMTDHGLVPSSTYQYKIRAVGNSGRSDYTPSVANQYLVIHTSADTENPSTPQNLTAEATAIGQITLTWSAATDNTGISGYRISYGTTSIDTGTPSTIFELKDLPLNTDYTFTVRAIDLANNLSGASDVAQATTYVNGLYYKHSTGAFSDIDLIDWSFVEYTGTVDNFTLAPRTQEDYFNFQFEGYLYIERGGTYQFQTSSDDGSRLTVDDATAVDNDGQHGTRTVTGSSIYLAAGAHVVNLKYFEYTGDQTLTVRYKGRDTGGSWRTIPNDALTSGHGSSIQESAYAPLTETNVTREKLAVDVYPNPALPGGDITVQVSGTTEPVSASVVDLMGQSKYQTTVDAENAARGFAVNGRKPLRKGIYFIIVQQGDQLARKILVVKE